MIPRPPRSTLCPYTTLFRSLVGDVEVFERAAPQRLKLCVQVNDAPYVVEEFLLFGRAPRAREGVARSEEHTSELQSPMYLVCRLLLEKKKNHRKIRTGSTLD